ncbi:hypothetical protein GQ457_10G013000 [Hibiscus cannabinus]
MSRLPYVCFLCCDAPLGGVARCWPGLSRTLPLGARCCGRLPPGAPSLYFSSRGRVCLRATPALFVAIRGAWLWPPLELSPYMLQHLSLPAREQVCSLVCARFRLTPPSCIAWFARAAALVVVRVLTGPARYCPQPFPCPVSVLSWHASFLLMPRFAFPLTTVWLLALGDTVRPRFWSLICVPGSWLASRLLRLLSCDAPFDGVARCWPSLARTFPLGASPPCLSVPWSIRPGLPARKQACLIVCARVRLVSQPCIAWCARAAAHPVAWLLIVVAVVVTCVLAGPARASTLLLLFGVYLFYDSTMVNSLLSMLGEHTFTAEEQDAVVVTPDAVAILAEDFACSLVGKVISPSPPLMEADLPGNFAPSRETIRTNVLKRGPWDFQKYWFALEQADPNRTIHDYSFQHMFIWVRIQNILLSLMTAALARALGASVGKVIMTDTRLEDGNMGEFMRVRVSFDTSKPLRRCVVLSRPDAKASMCPLQYECLPLFCHGCGLIGHSVLACPTTPKVEGQKFQYGMAEGSLA